MRSWCFLCYVILCIFYLGNLDYTHIRNVIIVITVNVVIDEKDWKYQLSGCVSSVV